MQLCAMSSSEDEELDQIDLFHARRESALARHGTSDEYSSTESDGDEEVMPLDLSTSEVDASSVEEDGERQDTSLKSWGRKVAAYYKEGEESEEGEESFDDELEEKEALQLQTMHAALLSQSDFDVQLPSGDAVELSSLIDEDMDMTVPADLANMDASEKDLLISRDHAELPHIIAGLKTALGCAVKATSLLNSSTDSPHMKNYLQTSVLVNLSYCLNSMYYLLLKADRVSVASHPVTSTLLSLRKLLGKLEGFDAVMKKQGSPVDTQRKHQSPVPTSKTADGEKDEDPLCFYHKVATQKKQRRENRSRLAVTFQEDLQPVDGKRAITYQISRNKGIGVIGKRQLRNPRVKHRLKYKKALLKRKSQVLPVAREMTKYGGETTGIKANLSRSTVIAS